ncbi:MAG TPA: DUF3576 domain-containing protein [Alphaproteobacteria bacterium]
MKILRFALLGLTLSLLPTLFLSGCSNVETKAEFPDRREGDGDTVYTGQRQGIFGKKGGGIGLFSSDKDKGNVASGISVNAYLWRASLDTLSFMPIANADPFGGTIITDWYSPPATPKERVKVNVFILDRTLRADGIKVSVFRQIANGNSWKDATVNPKTISDLEDTILTRARQLRVEAVGQ